MGVGGAVGYAEGGKETLHLDLSAVAYFDSKSKIKRRLRFDWEMRARKSGPFSFEGNFGSCIDGRGCSWWYRPCYYY